MTTEKTGKAVARGKQGSSGGKRSARLGESHVAHALRGAYQEAISEDVPKEFLDLLGKLT